MASYIPSIVKNSVSGTISAASTAASWLGSGVSMVTTPVTNGAGRVWSSIRDNAVATARHAVSTTYALQTSARNAARLNYTPAIEIVNAAAALTRFMKLVFAEKSPDSDNSNRWQETAKELNKFLDWLKLQNEEKPFSADFRKDVEKLVKGLENEGINLEFDFWTQFDLVHEQLNYWGRSSFVNRTLAGEVSPTPDSLVMKPLTSAHQIGKAFRRSLNCVEDDETLGLASQFVELLNDLVDEVHANRLPDLSRTEIDQRLAPELQRLEKAIEAENWHESTKDREWVIKITDRLLSSLDYIIRSRTTNLPQAQGQQNTRAVQPLPLPEEFHELLVRLKKLDVIIETRKNHDAILHYARTTWAFTAAILNQDEGDLNQIAIRYNLPPETIGKLRDFSEVLERAIVHRAKGTCNPASDNFVFSWLALEENQAPVPTQLELARRQLLHSLQTWKDTRKNTDGMKQWAMKKAVTLAVGEAPKQLVRPEPPEQLLEQANQFYADSLDNEEVRGCANSLLEKNDIPNEIRRPLQHLIDAEHPNPDDLKGARDAIASLLLLNREEEYKAAAAELKKEENKRPPENLGLAGKATNLFMGAAESLGIDQDSQLHSALRNLADGTVRAVNHMVHGNANTQPPSQAGEKNTLADTVKSTIRTGAGLLGLDKSTTKGIENIVDAGIEHLGIGSKNAEEISSAKRKKADAASFFELQAETEDAVDFNIAGSSLPVSDKAFDEEKDLFVQNNTGFVTMKVLYERICGCKLEDIDFYGEMIQKARAAGPAQEYSVLKEEFLKALEKAGVGSVLSSIVSWILFPIFYYATRSGLKLFATHGLAWGKDFIEKNHKDTSTKFANLVVDRTNGSLAILHRAYGRIADNPDITGNVDHELEKELTNPKFNYGMTQEQLHQDAANKLIDNFIEPGIVQWSLHLREACSQWHPFKDTIADTALNYAAVLASWAATVTLYPVEWIIRKVFLNLVVKRYVVNGELIKEILSAGVGSIKINGYTHALNCVLYDQLKDIYLTLQRGKKEEDPDLNYSLVDRAKLRMFVQELFTVLDKHGRSSEELRKIINNNSILKSGKDEFDNQFVYSKVVKSLEEVIGAALHSILKKDQLEKQFYLLLTTINSIYSTGQSISKSEYQKKEDDINRLLDAIITFSIDKSLDTMADFDREHEQSVVDGFRSELIALAKDLNKDSSKLFSKLDKTAEDETNPPPSQKNDANLLEMAKNFKSFNDKLIQWKRRIQASDSGLSKDGKEQLEAMEKNLRDQIEGMNKTLNSLHKSRTKQTIGDALKDALKKFKKILAAIIAAITGETQEEVSDKKIDKLKDLLKEIDGQRALRPQASHLDAELKKLEVLLPEFQDLISLQQLLDKEFNCDDPSSRISLWCKRKSNENYKLITAALARFSTHEKEHEQLTTLIEKMKNGKSERASLEEFQDDFKEACKKMRTALETGLETLKDKAEKIHENCDTALEECDLSEIGTPGGDAWSSVVQGMAQLKKWIGNSPKIKLAEDNSFFRPLKEKAVEFGKDYVTDRIRNKSEELLGFIRDPLIWHHGLYKHNILFPFIGKN